MVVEWAVAAAAATNLRKHLNRSSYENMITICLHPRLRRVSTRAGSLLLLFQRLPVIQMLFPEAQFLGGNAVANSLGLAVTTVIGLGAYDSVAGATAVAQVTPVSGSSTVPVSGGQALNFLFQLTGGGGHTPKSWSVVGTLPSGLSLTKGKVSSKTNTITGTTNQNGSFPITIKAWENNNYSGRSATGSFTLKVTGGGTPAAIATHPASITLDSGGTTTLTVVASGTSPFTYQWYQGNSGITTTPVGLDSASFTSPALFGTTSYWVKVTNSANPTGANSAAATITIRPAYDTWVTAAGIPANESSPLQNPAKDDINNLLKFAFNLDPTQTDVQTLTSDANDISGLPAIGLVNDRLHIEYIRRKASSNPGIRYTAECGSDLNGWALLLTGESVNAIGTTSWERVSHDGPSDQPRCFGRVKITQLP